MEKFTQKSQKLRNGQLADDLATGLVQTVPVHASGTLLIRSIYAYCET